MTSYSTGQREECSRRTHREHRTSFQKRTSYSTGQREDCSRSTHREHRTCFQKRTSYSTGQREECSRSTHREHRTSFQKRTSYSTGQREDCSRSTHREHRTCFQKRTSYSTGQRDDCSRSTHREHGPASRRGLPTAQGSGLTVPEASTGSTDLLPEEDFLQHRAAGGLFQKHAPGARTCFQKRTSYSTGQREDCSRSTHREHGPASRRGLPTAQGSGRTVPEASTGSMGPASRRGLPTAQGSGRTVPEARTGSTDLLPEVDFLQHRAAGGLFQKQAPGARTCFQKGTSYSTGQREDWQRTAELL
ncbi:hypothetical protein NDU88_000328 [Pleurodeles waltl]|uniref:Uncharacterized protein n=1 Tax=Pleurodeles waltl TaxID=8319 RepID=A0AAV7R3W3_PLEWA|nr:hypothetical protein NDU88_000328 [Pleurodeles waltl]